MKNIKSASEVLILVLIFFFFFLFFLIDYITPNYISTGVLYSIPVYLSCYVYRSKKTTIALSLIATSLIILGYFLFVADGLEIFTIANRFISIFVVWMFSLIGIKFIIIILQIQNLEKYTKTTLEASPTGMIMVNEQGKILFANQKMSDIFQYSKSELTNLSVDSLVSNNTRSQHPAFRNNFFQSPEPRQMGVGRELHGERKDGSHVPVEVGLTPIKTETGIKVISSIIDITERKKAEESIKRERDIMKLILDTNTDGWWDWNVKEPEKGYYSPRFKAVLGYTDEELPNSSESWEKIIYPPDKEEVIRLYHLHMQTDTKIPYILKTRYYHKNGSLVSFICKGTAIKDTNGEFTRMIGINFDVTIEEKLKNRLKIINQSLKEKNEDLEQFLYTVSHDLKAPLVSCMAFMDFLKEDLANNEMEKVADSIKELDIAHNKMRSRIKDILTVSRVRQVSLKIESIDLNKVVDSICHMFKDDNIQFSVEKLPIIRGDLEKITQSLENLISNAVKYCDKNKTHISIKSRDEYSYTIVTVEDNGPGIPEKYHKKIFAPFERLNLDKEGTGVGLAIVTKIMQMHGGKVTLDSKIGNGTAFHLYFNKNLQNESEGY